MTYRPCPALARCPSRSSLVVPTHRNRTAGGPARRAAAPPACALQSGDTLPYFELRDETGRIHRSTDLTTLGPVVLFTYPKAGSSGCTTQACGFRDNFAYFEERGYSIYGLSGDTLQDLLRWKKQHKFMYPLLSDPSLETLAALGATNGSRDAVLRSHIIIEKGGRVKAMRISVSSRDSVPEVMKVLA